MINFFKNASKSCINNNYSFATGNLKQVRFKYKMRNNTACKLRFKVTGSGKLMRTQGGLRKNVSKKSGKLKRKKRGWVEVTHHGTLKLMKRLLPYWKISV